MAKDPKNTNIFSTLGASNHSKNERQKEDYYTTDPRFINHLIEKEPWLKNPELKILEPSAGGGVLVDRFFELQQEEIEAEVSARLNSWANEDLDEDAKAFIKFKLEGGSTAEFFKAYQDSPELGEGDIEDENFWNSKLVKIKSSSSEFKISLYCPK